MYIKKKVYAIWIIQMLLMLTLIHTADVNQSSMFILTYGMFFVAFLLSSKGGDFILIILAVLLYGGYFLYKVFSIEHSNIVQVEFIKLHLIFILNLLVLYLSSYNIKLLVEENIKLKDKVKSLEKFVDNSAVLSETEFKERGEIILNSLRRRKSTGVFITIGYKNVISYASDTFFYSFTDSIKETIRNDYDLIGIDEDGQVKILLQETDEHGASIFLDRLMNNLSKNIEEKILKALNFKLEKILPNGKVALL